MKKCKDKIKKELSIMLIIGAIGPIGSGKDTVLQIIFENFDFEIISIGDLVRDLTRERGLGCTRENLQQTSLMYFSKYGRDFFPKKVIEIIEKNGYENVCISGIRTCTDVEVLKNHYDNKFFLIYVRADKNIRFNRLKNRNEERDPKNFNEFLIQDLNEEKFQFSEAIQLSDYTIDNKGSLEDLKNDVYRMIRNDTLFNGLEKTNKGICYLGGAVYENL
ncbi:MAG TPA: AAA family ATPase [Candidatus Methanoperedens sp.]